jgi:hypothetical protein
MICAAPTSKTSCIAASVVQKQHQDSGAVNRFALLVNMQLRLLASSVG